MNQWAAIAKNYEVERDELSFPALLIDGLVSQLLGNGQGRRLLDYGAGSGTLSRLASRQGYEVVAYEPMPEMREIFEKLTPSAAYGSVSLSSDDTTLPANGFDVIICSNVFDHVIDVPGVLRRFATVLKPGGRLVLSIPHPLKNLGGWVKTRQDGAWTYEFYRLNDYLKEGEVRRNREDVEGNLIISDVVSQHRTIATYYNWIAEAGFSVTRMHEPAPTPDDEAKFPILYTQSSRISYFWILDCQVRGEKTV
jgi:2-polyprenyl-3-methyl-5-hydroxy-6-metoxy-1,4-benzoquinol methylase